MQHRNQCGLFLQKYWMHEDTALDSPSQQKAEKLRETCLKYIDLNLGVVEELKPPEITLPQYPDTLSL